MRARMWLLIWYRYVDDKYDDDDEDDDEDDDDTDHDHDDDHDNDCDHKYKLSFSSLLRRYKWWIL